MATILSLALKVNADASGVVKNLTPAERALENLGKQAAKATSVFDEFAGTSAAAAVAQFNASKSLSDLSDSLKRGEISAQEFASRYADLTAEINKEAAAFKRAAQITEANISPAEKYSRTVAELDDQLRAGRISQETYNRALEKAKGDLDKTSTAVAKTDKSMESLARNTKILAGIEIGRLFLDGLSAIGNVFQDIGSRVTSLVSSVNSSVDTLNDFSARTGIGVEALQGYSLAAKLAGVDTEQFGAAVQKLAVNIGKATPGDALDKSLRGINLSVQELRALAPEDQFSAIGNAISQLPTAADRAAAAVEIFGKQGAALAPLFREGAASLEELKAKAERLGIIVSETQVNNVADMNDAFDLVRATIEGIVGQVIGNLAPAVTDVTNQFLKFVESWSGAQGEGGTGIANAITDVLLQGAEYFAAVFDEFVSGLTGLGITFEDTSATFVASANLFTFVVEGLRTVANVFELAGNGLSAALGKIIETLGSFVSSDLEEYGKELTRQAMIATEKNSRQLEDAAANAGRAFVGIFTADGGTAQNAGKGAAESYLSGLREEIRRQRSPEVKIQASLGDAAERLTAYFKTAEDGGSKFFQQSADTVAKFQKMAEEGGLTADQIQVMNGFMADLNGKLDQEIAQRQQAAEAAAAQAEADKKRIDTLLAASEASAKLEQDLQAVQREQARVSEELAAARAAGDKESADAAASRLAQLDQLRTKLEDQSQAISQGFADGFSAAFNNTAESISGLIDKAAQFGNAGAEAAMKLQEGVALVQEQTRDGIILSSDVYEREINRQRSIFEESLAQIEQQRQAEQQAKAAVFQLEVDANQRVNEFIAQRTQAEVAGAEQAAARRQQAAFNIEAIEQRIALERQSLEAAREQNDMNAARAAVQRIDLLKDALSVEQQIADGREQELQKQQQLIANQQQFQRQQQAAVQAYQQQQQQAQQAYAQEQARIFEEQRKAAEAEAKRQEERLRKLNTLGQQSISVADVRNVEGANLVLQTAANAQDPALIQARLQTKLLEQVALGISQAASNYFNQPVAIVGAARLN